MNYLLTITFAFIVAWLYGRARYQQGFADAKTLFAQAEAKNAQVIAEEATKGMTDDEVSDALGSGKF